MSQTINMKMDLNKATDAEMLALAEKMPPGVVTLTDFAVDATPAKLENFVGAFHDEFARRKLSYPTPKIRTF